MSKKFLPIPEDIGDFVCIDETSPSGLRWTANVGTQARPGKVAGSLNSRGYYSVKFRSKAYKVHRVIQFLHTGINNTTLQIDHKDRDKKNNRIDNLRLANDSQQNSNKGNYKNNSSGYSGVCKHHKKYSASIQIDGKQTHLGQFCTAEEAAHAVNEARVAKDPEFCVLNVIASPWPRS